MIAKRTLRCWKDKREAIAEKFGDDSEEYWATFQEDYVSGSCMLEAGHDGPHEFTPDDEIGVRFK